MVASGGRYCSRRPPDDAVDRVVDGLDVDAVADDDDCSTDRSVAVVALDEVAVN